MTMEGGKNKIIKEDKRERKKQKRGRTNRRSRPLTLAGATRHMPQSRPHFNSAAIPPTFDMN